MRAVTHEKKLTETHSCGSGKDSMYKVAYVTGFPKRWPGLQWMELEEWASSNHEKSVPGSWGPESRQDVRKAIDAFS